MGKKRAALHSSGGADIKPVDAAPSPRRSARSHTVAPVDKEEEHIAIRSTKTMNPSKGHNGSKKKKNSSPLVTLEEHSDKASADEWVAEEDESMSDAMDEERPRKRRKSLQDNSDLSCPHCHKVLSSALGHQYHVDQFVCRPALRPGGPIVRGRRKKNSDASNEMKYPRIRGKNVADRTCPQCQRVFTSVHGMQYHRDKRVCEQRPSNTTSTTPYATIDSGQCFVTPYGIVQVISDDRATPTAVLDNHDQAKSKMKLYHGALAKREARQQKQLINVAVISQARRMLLQREYETNNNSEDAQGIRNIYEICGRLRTTSLQPRTVLEDPSAPPDSFPDRIVEGILIPDQRPRYLGPLRETENDSVMPQDFTLLEGLAATSDMTAAVPKIFLPRRLLTTLYSPESARYYCPLCFQCFGSKPGYKYHVDVPEGCRAQAKALGLGEQRRTVEERARQFVARYPRSNTKPQLAKNNSPSAADPSAVMERHRVTPRPRKKSGGTSAPPPAEPLATLPQGDDDNDVSSSTPHEPDSHDLDAVSFVSPDITLAQLEAEFYRIQGSMIGPMYPSIWKALGYRKPATKKKRRSNRDSSESDALAALQQASKPTIPSAILDRSDLPIVDIYPLVQEVDAGRYPSMKRYSGEIRDDQCSICKQGEIAPPASGSTDENELLRSTDHKLIPCNFCRQVEHFTCAQTKFVIKYPEAGDDFMCHNCIGIIAARRSRAEKRRLEKLYPEEETSKSVSLQEQRFNSTDPTRLEELHALTSGVIRDREFECVAAQGSRLEELSVLLLDAKTRLSLRLEVMKLNQARLSLMETAYNDDENGQQAVIVGM